MNLGFLPEHLAETGIPPCSPSFPVTDAVRDACKLGADHGWVAWQFDDDVTFWFITIRWPRWYRMPVSAYALSKAYAPEIMFDHATRKIEQNPDIGFHGQL